MKKIYTLILLISMMSVSYAQKNECSGFVSDAGYFRYTASGYQEVINGNHSKAINESRKIANIIAESELAKMIKSAVTRVVEVMSEENIGYSEKIIDTTLVSSYNVFHEMKTICQSETKFIDNMYVTYVTKEISIEHIGDVLCKDDKKKKKELINKMQNK